MGKKFQLNNILNVVVFTFSLGESCVLAPLGGKPQPIYYQNSFWVPQAPYLQHHRKAFFILLQQFQSKFLILLKSVAKLISSDYHFYADIIFFSFRSSQILS